MTKESYRKYYELFTDAWKLYREFADMKNTTEDWQRYRDQAHELDKKHKSKLFRKMANAIADELERKWKN